MIDHLIRAGCEVVLCAVNSGLTRAISHISSYPNEFIDKTVSDDQERIRNGENAEFESTSKRANINF